MSQRLGPLVTYFSVRNPQAAKRLVDKLISSPNDSLILPFIDHPGPISQEILSREFSSLIVCERNEPIRRLFQSRVEERFAHKNIRVYGDDLFDLSFKTYSDKAQRRCSDIVRESVETSQSNSVKLLVPLLQSLNEAGFLRNLYYQMCLRIGLCADTLVNYYFLMSDRQYSYLSAKPCKDLRHYRSSTVLYNTIFDIHQLDSFDLEANFDITIRQIQKTSHVNHGNYRRVHVLWLEPRLSVIDSLSPTAFMEFRFLINQVMHRRTRHVLTFLENWFENCEGDIAHLGIDDSTRSGDLDKSQYLELFNCLRRREDYNRSTFRQAAACSEDNIQPFSDD